MPRDCVLIATLGQTDVQIVVTTKSGEKKRVNIEKSSQRNFHNACHDDLIEWEMLSLLEPEPEELYLGREGLHYDTVKKTLSFPNTSNAQDVSLPGTGETVELWGALLSRVCKTITQRIQNQELGQVKHVLLLNTNRGRPDEPFAAGFLLREALAQALGIGEDRVEECIFLEEGQIEETVPSGQEFCRRDVVKSIDDKIREVASVFPEATAVVSDIGGLPITKAVIAESCRYRFRDRVIFRPTGHQGPLQIIPPVESLSSRRRIRNLIRTGAFTAAAGMAMDDLPSQVAPVEPWRRWLDDLAVAIDDGMAPDICLSPTDVNQAQASRMLAKLSRIHRLGPAAMVAIRIENALRRDNLALALRELFSLLDDVGPWQVIDSHLSAQGQHCIDWEDDKFCPENCNQQGFTIVVGINRCGRYPNNMADYQQQDPIPLGYDVVIDGHRQRLKTALFSRAFNPNSPTRQHLDRWIRLCRDPIQGLDMSMRDVRNRITHGTATRQQLDCVSQVLCGVYWNLDAGHNFMQGEESQNLFNILGIQPIRNRYDDLLNAIEQDMDEYSLQPDPANPE